VQANEKIGLTFGKILRAVLRQDPDVIMIGEVRDDETAQIALRGAITGHLILSTIHTKDTISTPIRLVDMGVPGYMVAGALQGVLAQRLIRTSCQDCLTSYTPTSRDEIWFREFYKLDIAKIEFKHGTGCNHCNNTGYVGRTGLYELLEIDDELMNYLYNNELTMFNKRAKEKMIGKTMADGVKTLVLSGQTTVEEAKRMIG
jgi:MSHA biogenesis protein MshE